MLLEVFFAGLKSLLKLIFASTAGPANLDFEATLWHFLKFFSFSEDRVENDFKVISDFPKAQKTSPKSTRSGPKSLRKTATKTKQKMPSSQVAPGKLGVAGDGKGERSCETTFKGKVIVAWGPGAQFSGSWGLEPRIRRF